MTKETGLQRGSVVEVRQVANGYVVMPAAGYERNSTTGDNERYVFQTFAELIAWMSEHFTHRAEGVAGDGA